MVEAILEIMFHCIRKTDQKGPGGWYSGTKGQEIDREIREIHERRGVSTETTKMK
jgi:hypothetical protein